jgi:hypothetical protein
LEELVTWFFVQRLKNLQKNKHHIVFLKWHKSGRPQHKLAERYRTN